MACRSDPSSRVGDAPPHPIAIYDLDRTITRTPTWSAFLLHAAWTRAPWRLTLLPLIGVAAALNALGLLSRRSLKQVMHRSLLGIRSAAQLEAVATSFATAFAHRIRPGARAQIAADRAAGYRIVVATAAYSFYAAALLRDIPVDDLIATEAATDQTGRVLPQIVGTNCYGADKLAMIQHWLRDQGIARSDAHIRFYSDHVSDAPTFAWADAPCAVHPHAPLKALAETRGWPVLDWS